MQKPLWKMAKYWVTSCVNDSVTGSGISFLAEGVVLLEKHRS